MARRKRIDMENIVEIHEAVRVDAKDRTPGLHYYHCRHADMDWSVPISIEQFVLVNFWGMIATKEPLELGKYGIDLSKKDGERIVHKSQGV